jgi:molybdate transport system substrate-binding protein
VSSHNQFASYFCKNALPHLAQFAALPYEVSAVEKARIDSITQTTMTPLNILSAGAAMGLVQSILGGAVTGRFGAVGAMHDAFLAGEACDVLILARKQLDELTAQGAIVEGSLLDIGHVKTGIAVRAGTPFPAIHDTASLRAALLACTGLYAPDLVKSTAGQHVAKMLADLGIAAAMQSKLHAFPNGAIAMKTMAASPANAQALPLGCTQATEILYTPGVQLAGLLPAEFELSTLYSVAIPTRSNHAAAAQAQIERLVNSNTLAARRAAGFEC